MKWEAITSPLLLVMVKRNRVFKLFRPVFFAHFHKIVFLFIQISTQGLPPSLLKHLLRYCLPSLCNTLVNKPNGISSDLNFHQLSFVKRRLNSEPFQRISTLPFRLRHLPRKPKNILYQIFSIHSGVYNAKLDDQHAYTFFQRTFVRPERPGEPVKIISNPWTIFTIPDTAPTKPTEAVADNDEEV